MTRSFPTTASLAALACQFTDQFSGGSYPAARRVSFAAYCAGTDQLLGAIVPGGQKGEYYAQGAVLELSQEITALLGTGFRLLTVQRALLALQPVVELGNALDVADEGIRTDYPGLSDADVERVADWCEQHDAPHLHELTELLHEALS